MKKLMTLMVLGMLLGNTAGCRIAECWRYAWNSRFHPQQQQAAVYGPCVVTDPCCNPCPSPCNAAPVITPSPMPVR
jgi:hypothetical protein